MSSASTVVSGRGLRVGLYLPLVTGDFDRHLELALEAERLGFARVWARDLPFSEKTSHTDQFALRDQGFEVMTYLSALAATTSTIGLGSAVVSAPLRHPALLAKQAASLDVLSQGRFVLGVGTGFPSLYDAFGVPFDERADRLVEGVQLMRELWQTGPVTGRSRFGELSGQRVLPEPFTPGGPPVYVASGAIPARKELSIYDGWMRNRRSLSKDKADLAEYAAAGSGDTRRQTFVLDVAVAIGQPAGLPVQTTYHGNVLVCEPAELLSALRVYASLGADEVLLAFVGRTPPPEQMRIVAAQVLPAFHRVAA